MMEHEYDARTANRYMNELDRRFMVTPSFPGIKGFPKGISSLSQMTAREFAAIIKVLAKHHRSLLLFWYGNKTHAYYVWFNFARFSYPVLEVSFHPLPGYKGCLQSGTSLNGTCY